VSTAETRRGLTFGASAYLIWGLLPLYWPLLKPAGALEILAHRMLWSLVVIVVLLWLTRGFGAARAVFANRRQRTLLATAAVVVSVNWGVYIWGVNSSQVVETSLGYFINPLLTVMLGVALFHERLRWLQWVAVGIASVAIIVLAVDYGRLPWIALTLATSFAIYGYLKKRAVVGAAESLAVETTVMAVPAAVTLLVLQLRGTLVFAHHGGGSDVLLLTTGLVTAVPLLLFAAATRRLPLSTVGLLQYLAPVLQFAVGVGIDHEPMPTARWAGFALIWIALAVLTADAARSRRAARAVERSVAATAV
jgi:chloramphenicol-sensitive protein RarD